MRDNCVECFGHTAGQCIHGSDAQRVLDELVRLRDLVSDEDMASIDNLLIILDAGRKRKKNHEPNISA